MNKRYYSLVMSEDKSEADINIFGDITSWAWEEFGEVSANMLSKQLEEMGNVKTINVHISSYGGEVKEGLAIYNALKNHKAKVKTYCDGFACSIASVIFMAGDERIMSKSSLLMIHNAWMFTSGNANELRKQADDLDKMTQASVNAYMEHVSISEKELKELLDNESWLDYEQCLEMGFATSIVGESKSEKASQSVRKKLVQMILEKQAEDEEETEDEENTNNDDSPNVDEPNVDEPETEDEEETNEELDEEETSNDEEETETSDEDEEENKDDEEEEINANQKAINFFKVISKM